MSLFIELLKPQNNTHCNLKTDTLIILIEVPHVELSYLTNRLLRTLRMQTVSSSFSSCLEIGNKEYKYNTVNIYGTAKNDVERVSFCDTRFETSKT